MDRLTLRIENRSDAAGDMPEDISVLGKGLSIGRKAANDWSLPDSTRFISGKHIAISFEDDAYFLEDVSTNGTFMNGAPNRISGKHKLTDGDMIRIGSYIVAVLLEVVEDPVVPTISGAQGVQAPPMAARMTATTTGVQRNHTTTTSAQGAQKPDFSRFQAGGKGTTGVTGVQRPGGLSMPPISAPPPSANVIPDDFDDDLLGAAPAEVIKETPPTPKGNPAPPDAIPVERVKPAVDPLPEPELKPMPVAPPPPVAETPTPPPPEAPVAAAPVVTPDAPFGVEEPAEPVLAPQPVNIPEPVAPPEPARNSDGPFSMSDPTGVGAIPVVSPRETAARPASVVEKTDMTPRGLGERFVVTKAPRATPAPDSAPPAAAIPVTPAPADAPQGVSAPTPVPPVASEPVSPPPEAPAAAPAPIPAPAPEQPPVAAPPPEPVSNALLDGFLEGAGIDDPDALSVPLHELGVMLGRCARLGTQEMMQMLQDRSAVKLFVAQEDRTMRIASGNNPMKFMMDPDDAFTALFVTPRDGYQTGPDGFDNALSDIRQHQQAMMAAIQPALADMLEGLAPTEISGDVGSGGGVLGSGARKSWDEYTKRWESRAAQGENGMLDAFIDAFSRRYNQALDSL